jgi:hypothetical protein
MFPVMEMTRARVRVVLGAAWIATMLLLIYVAGVPAWLALVANIAGGVVIRNYARALPEGSPSRGERALRVAAYIFLGTVAAAFALLLAVTMLAFLVAGLVQIAD